MRTGLSTIALMISVSFLSSAYAEDESLKDSDNRINYSLGYQIGQDMVKQRIELREADVRDGLSDGYLDTSPRVEPSIMRQSLSSLKRDISGDMKKEAIERVQNRRQRIASLQQQSAEFLNNKSKETGVVVLDSGLQYKVIREGEGSSPGATDVVTLAYEARKMNGKVYDSSRRFGGTVKRPVKKAIRGISEAVKLMKPGAKWELYIPPELAYGRRDVPLGNQAVVIDLELIDFEPAE